MPVSLKAANMRTHEYYKSREQTYLKHFFLERYLERVGFNICSFKEEFVYVDGFSGPWKSTDEKFEDTSFMIAIQELRKVREGVAKLGRKPPKIRCLFIEKGPGAYRELNKAIEGVTDIEVEAIQGEFEEVIPAVLKFIGTSFSLVFIDPTGWTGFGLERITPLLKHRPGEVIINFMFDYINRHFGVCFDELFGGAGWTPEMSESETVQLYCERVKAAGGFDFVTSTCILNPTKDRTYFHLIYGTRHWKGVYEFRKVEKQFVDEQERVRTTAKQASRIDRTGQNELFAAIEVLLDAPSYEMEKESQLRSALDILRSLLSARNNIGYKEFMPRLLELPLVWESDVNEMVMKLRGKELEVDGLKPKERTLKREHILRKLTAS
jgi:three-Cys-motif partner protein